MCIGEPWSVANIGFSKTKYRSDTSVLVVHVSICWSTRMMFVIKDNHSWVHRKQIQHQIRKKYHNYTKHISYSKTCLARPLSWATTVFLYATMNYLTNATNDHTNCSRHRSFHLLASTGSDEKLRPSIFYVVQSKLDNIYLISLKRQPSILYNGIRLQNDRNLFDVAQLIPNLNIMMCFKMWKLQLYVHIFTFHVYIYYKLRY